MLAKQVWRLLCEPESLCARVLRARYYPDEKLLNAKLKSGSSYTWQSVMAGLECFKLGYIWRVGDGTQINIWEDNWILGSQNMKIQMLRANNLVTRVDELINPVDLTWDADLVRSILLGIDATRILQIPITWGREDCVAWHFNRSGLFLVRSTYHGQWKMKYGAKLNGAWLVVLATFKFGRIFGNSKCQGRLGSSDGGPFMVKCPVNLYWQIRILYTRGVSGVPQWG
jgi:hypothetical protein